MANYNILTEVPPISKQDSFVVFERRKSNFNFPIHIHSEYELNYIIGARGARRRRDRCPTSSSRAKSKDRPCKRKEWASSWRAESSGRSGACYVGSVAPEGRPGSRPKRERARKSAPVGRSAFSSERVRTRSGKANPQMRKSMSTRKKVGKRIPTDQSM